MGTTQDRRRLDELVARARRDLRDWTDSEKHDPGVALMELLAYVAELLSDYSDRVADEGYLGGGGPAPRRRASDHVEVEVDGSPWHRVTDLSDSAEADPDYVVTAGADGTSVVEFGDGVHGRRPPAGSSIRVRYRGGGREYTSVLGQEGRVVLDTDWGEDPAPALCGVHRAVVLDDVDPLARQRLLVRVPGVNGDRATWAAACLPVGAPPDVPSTGEGVWVAFEAGDPSSPVWLGRSKDQ